MAGKPSDAEKPEKKAGLLSFRTVIGLLVIGLGFVLAAQALGLTSKVSLNVGPVTYEISGAPAASGPQTASGSSASPNMNSAEPQAVNVGTTQCPQRPGWIYLPSWFTWYPLSNGDYVYYDNNGMFWTWEGGDQYHWFNYSPYSNPIQRNQWVGLRDTAVTICVDTAGNVYSSPA